MNVPVPGDAPQKQKLSVDANIPFWNKQWQENKIGFHRLAVNKFFETYILSNIISSEQQQCVFFPLCGKTVDMKAVLDAKHQVIGIDCARLGVEAFFQENNIKYNIEPVADNHYEIYKGVDWPVTIFLGDFFALNRKLPTIDWIWDRGGLVAVNVADREKYRDTLLRLMTPGHTRLYLLAIYYDDPNFTGPARCLTDEHVAELFGSTCSVELVTVSDATEEFNLHSKMNLKLMEERLHLIIRK